MGLTGYMQITTTRNLCYDWPAVAAATTAANRTRSMHRVVKCGLQVVSGRKLCHYLVRLGLSPSKGKLAGSPLQQRVP